jgi:long-chain fatty acid transport protein
MNRVLIAAGLTTLTAHTYAGGFDNSNFNFDAIYRAENTLNIEYGHSNIPMQATIEKGAGSGTLVKSGKILKDMQRPVVAISYHINDKVPCAAKYEQPYAANVAYQDDSLAYDGTDPETGGNTTFTAPIATEYESESVTVACGYRFNLSTGNLLAFTGPKYQSIKGFLSEDLSASDEAVGADDNMVIRLNGGHELGYIAGIAYSIPEYSMRASLLYHSQVNYDLKGSNNTYLPSVAGGAQFRTSLSAKTFTPQTIELALQSGISNNTLVALRLRWSEYSKLKKLVTQADDSVEVGGITLAQIDTQITQLVNSQRSQNGLQPIDSALSSLFNPELDMFSNDTLDYSFSIGHQFNPKTAMGLSFSGEIKLGSKDDSIPLGADSSSLRLPGDTAHTVALGLDHQVARNFSLYGGLAYTFIDDYRAETSAAQGSFRAEFEKTHAISLQLGINYTL